MKVEIKNGKPFINPQLTDDQQKQYDVLKWLVGHGPRGSGRTYLLALAFIQTALDDPTMHVHLYDHGNSRYQKEDMVRTVLSILQSMQVSMENDNDSQYKLNFSLSRRTSGLQVELERKLPKHINYLL